MLSEVLTRFAPKGLQILQQAIQKVSVTGKTFASLKFIVDIPNQKLTYLGRGFMETLEHGRGPRKNSTYSNFDNSLEEWMQAKGFTQLKTKTGKKYYQIGDQWFSAKSLAWKINKEGDKQFKSGQVKEVYSKAMDEFKNDLIGAIKKDQAEELKNKVSSIWH